MNMSAKTEQTSKNEATLSQRQASILTAVIHEYVATAEPVGSQTIVSRYAFAVSPATVRNEMMALENAGYLVSPHTSAGRIPTEAGYRYYIKNFLEQRELPKAETREVQSVFDDMHGQADRLRRAAKVVAQHSSESVFMTLGDSDVFYTGLTNLFRQPEFREQLPLAEISGVFDRLDDIIAAVYEELPDDVAVLVGSENPFGSTCAVIVSRFRTQSSEGLFGILGPTRMDYDANVARVKLVHEYIDNLL